MGLESALKGLAENLPKNENVGSRPVNSFVTPLCLGMDYSPKQIYGVIIDERGMVRLCGGGVPTQEETKKILADAKKHKVECQNERDKLREREFEYYERLWEINHPIQVGWRKFKNWLKAV